MGALGGNEAGTKNLESSPVRIHAGFTPSRVKRVNSHAAGIIMRRLASEMELWRMPRYAESSVCVFMPQTEQMRA